MDLRRFIQKGSRTMEQRLLTAVWKEGKEKSGAAELCPPPRGCYGAMIKSLKAPPSLEETVTRRPVRSVAVTKVNL